MAFNIFKKEDAKNGSRPKGEAKKTPVKKEEVAVEETKTDASVLNVSEGNVISSFYISEKAGLLNAFNQYVFKVSKTANKNELKKQVERMFSVKVKDVKILNTFGKNRNVGRHAGFKPGFKKAIVVLRKGYAIEQAKV